MLDGLDPNECTLALSLVKKCGYVSAKEHQFIGNTCWLESVVLNAQGDVFYEWSDGTHKPDQRFSCGEEIFTLTITDDSGCTASATGTMTGINSYCISPPLTHVQLSPNSLISDQPANALIQQQNPTLTGNKLSQLNIFDQSGNKQYSHEFYLDDSVECNIQLNNIRTNSLGWHILTLSQDGQVLDTKVININ